MSGHYSVSLAGPAPWGFRLQGGKDFNMPLTISRLTDGGKAAKASIAVGDLVLSIDGIATEGMNHLEAQNKIKACAGNLELSLQKASSVPKVTEVVKEVSTTVVNGPGSMPKKTAPPRVPRRPIVETDIHFYHVPSHGDASKKRLMEDTEDWHPRTGTSQSRSFRILAQITGTGDGQPEGLDSEGGKKQPQTVSGQVSPPVRKGTPSELSSGVAPAQLSNGVEEESAATPRTRHAVGTQTDAPLEETQLGSLLSVDSTPNSGQPAGPAPSLQSTDFAPSLQTTGSSPSLQSTSSAPSLQSTGPAPALQTTGSSPFPLQTADPAPAQTHGIISDAPPTQPHAPPPVTERRPEGAVSPSLLDALLISPVFRAPPLRLRKKKRRTKSALHLQKMKSVSWHQSVTDLSDPALSSPVSAVYILSDLTEEPSSPAVKTMTKAPTGGLRNTNSAPATTYKPPTALGAVFPKPGAQIGHVAPAFGSVTNSSAKVPVPAPDRPAPRPHPKDEDSLVQRAEHMPAGTRTPMCGHCNMAIRGPFLVAMGKSWHPEEFTCAHCHGSLADVGFVEERGAVYCEHCYEEFFAPTCGRCQHKILGEVINALKQTWHMSCFLCVSCQKPIGNSTFHLEDGEPYCERDYYTLFGTSCRGCDFPIEAGDKFLEALGATWHDTCFVCTVCCASLEGQAFFSKNGKPLCKKHAHTVKI
ncbi:PDZ and LIM domain protein 7-like isoform X2 [Anguilla anguilla]|uniref:PDZ and LIM domain protein 7-like isoform X2 n=1 Tax=Anguilla anguilla TaxID=7936 RepID=UPI0015B0C669|nr:PDZ and LIM domain protein 7-like isoform X2 [Anguilla anguilla]